MKVIRLFLITHKNLALLVLVALWFVFSSPYFLKGKVPYPSSYQVNHFAPWSADSNYWGKVKNGAMPDVIDQIYPWRHLTIESWKKGEIPLWNPFNFTGNPHLADFQSAVFSPTNILFFILPFLDAWSISILLQPLIAGIGMFLFARTLQRSVIGSLTSSISFMFCGFVVVWMAYGTLALAISFLPWVLYSIELYRKKQHVWYLLFTSLFLAVSFFSGHFQTSLYLLLFSGSYALASFLPKRTFRNFLPIIFLSIGLLIASIQIIPSVAFYNYSVRSDIYIQNGGIQWQYLTTLFAPNYYGNPVTQNDWFGYYAEWASFIGIIPFCLALIALHGKKSWEKIFFISAGIISLILSLDTPLQKIIGILHIPVLSTSYPARIIVLCSFSLAMLAAYGWDELSLLIQERKTRRIFPVVLAVAVILLISWTAAAALSFIPPDKRRIAERNLVVPTALFLVFVTGAASISLKKMKYGLLFLGIVLVSLTSVDSLMYASKWMPFDPRPYVFPDMPVLSAMQGVVGHGRVFGNLGAQVSTYYHLPILDGYDALYSKRYGEFIQSAEKGTFTEAQRSVVTLGRRSAYTDRVLDLLDVTTIYHPIADTNQGWAYPVWEKDKKYSLVYHDTHFQLFKNLTAMQRPTLYYHYTVVPDDKKAINMFYSEAFDFRHTLILDQKPTLDIPPDSSGSAQILSETFTKLVIRVDTKTPALLFLADTYYPGWQVQVNGVAKQIIRADIAFRAVEVPAGKSTVIFSYTKLF